MSYIGNIPVTGDNNSFKLLDDITSHTLTFDGSSTSVVSTADNTISSTDHRFLTGQRVTYNDGGGTAITGLSDGVYYIIKHSQNTIQLAANASDAALGTDINLAGVGAGTAHTLNVAFDGVNTNFRATFDSGIKAGITRAAQLQISINGVIQQPQDTATPTTGFGIDVDSIIAFSTAPVSTDVFWGSLVAKNFPTFDISNNDTDTFTGDNSTVSFTLSKDSKDARNILVTLDGVVQYPSSPGVVRAYDVSQNVLSFASAPGLGVDISVRHIGFAGPSNITKNTIGITSAGTTIDTDAQTLNFTGPEFDVTSSGITADIGLTGTFAGDISIADKIIHTGDTNTAIRFPAADTFTVETGGSERLRITGSTASFTGNITGSTASFTGNVSVGGTLTYDDVTNIDSVGLITARTGIHVTGGSVGIGTDNPNEELHIHASGTSYVRFTDESSGIGATHGSIFGLDHPHLYAWNYEAGDFVVATNATEKLRVTSNGDVGIGTAIPITAANYTSLSLANTSGAQIELKRTGNNSTHYIWTDTNDNLNIGANYSGIGTGDLVLKVGGNNERLRINSSGYMTTAPSGMMIRSGFYDTGVGVGAKTSPSTSWITMNIDGTGQILHNLTKFSTDGLTYNKVSDSSHLNITANFPFYYDDSDGGGGGFGVRAFFSTDDGSNYHSLSGLVNGPCDGWGAGGYGGTAAGVFTYTWNTRMNSTQASTILAKTGNVRFYFECRIWSGTSTLFMINYDATYNKKGTIIVQEIAE